MELQIGAGRVYSPEVRWGPSVSPGVLNSLF